MSRHKVIVIAATVFIVVAIAVLMTVVDPMQAQWFPKCPSKYVTGYDCPGCGTSRALHALMHGDVAAAWHFNAAIFFAIPLILFLVAGTVAGPHSRLRRISQHPALTIGVTVAIVAWTIGRNL